MTRILILFFLLFIASCSFANVENEESKDMALIPANEFLLGVNPGKDLPAFLSSTTSSANAQPMQKYYLDSYYIDRFEVRYEDFIKFKPKAQYKNGRPGEPIRGISWFEADAYCLSLGKRLPTEFEWEKAARGADGRLFVWGNKFEKDAANLNQKIGKTGTMEKDRSVYGVYDMNGNVSEWTSSWYLPYPESNFEDKNFGKKYKVTRGGAFSKRDHGFMEEFARVTYRNFVPPNIRSWDTGFRCARSK